MARRLTRNQQLENRAFLAALRETGNIRLAARRVGLSPATLHGRRKAHPRFAHAWAVAIAFASARFHAQGGKRPAAGAAVPAGPAGDDADAAARAAGMRTRGGEPVIVARRDGKLQLRAAQPGKLTKACEQTFLAALSASANVALSARAAGASTRAFQRRKRQRPGFAREWRLALEQGYEAVELALLETQAVAACEDDAWRHNTPPATPPMRPEAALQLLYLHQKEARLGGTPPRMRRRPGESERALSMRLGLMHEWRELQARERFAVEEEARRARGEPTIAEQFAGAPVDLAQVTGWSKASGKPPYREGVALFGGWRLEEMKKRR